MFNNNSSSTPIEVDNYTNWYLQISLLPFRFVCPILLIFCPLANFCCISVFRCSSFKKSSSKWYFIFIAISDTIYVLVTAPLMLLLSFDVYILNWNIFTCKIIIFLNYLSCQISAGLLACLSVDRLFATSFFVVYRQHCSTSLSKIICILVILTFSIVNSHYLFGYTIDSRGLCTMTHYVWYSKIYSQLNIVYLLSYSIVPFTIITVCNVLIVNHVCRMKSTMKRKYSNNQSFPLENISNNFRKSFSTMKNNDAENDARASIIKSLNLKNRGRKSSSATAMDSIRLLGQRRKSSRKDSNENSMMTIAIINNRQSRTSTLSTRIGSQLQITISLIAISISFIFCTLPNCISTIMIENYRNDSKTRALWQALNFVSIVPLLITHSVNVIFYYLSSHMFRKRLKEMIFSSSVSRRR